MPKEVARYVEQLKDGDSDIRMRAACMLVFIGAPAVEPLKEILAVYDTRGAGMATWVLGKIIDPRAVPALVGALSDHNNSGVRTAAAQALGGIKDSSTVPALIEALRDEDRGVQVAAARALGEIGDKSAVTPLQRQLKRKPDVYVRECLTEAIKKLEEK